MFKPPIILDKRHRNDPFYEIPSVSETEFKKGLNYLLNKGIIPKDYDLTPAFEKGHPPIEKAKIRLAPFEKQFVARPSAHLCDYSLKNQMTIQNVQRSMQKQLESDGNVFLTAAQENNDLQRMKFSYKQKDMLQESQ